MKKRKKLKEKELTEKSGVAYLIRGLQEKNLDLTWQELYTWYQKSPEWKAAVDRICAHGTTGVRKIHYRNV